MKYGFPGMENILSYSDYIISYDQRSKIPRWVFEHLTPESVSKKTDVDRSKCDFREDANVHQYFRYINSD